ncbi:MAG: M66 family metalloprotease [Proteobacteria bacterium]|jgi:hypothetical protein|nr:M66 family metalloprotease [Pseudomonadota bacterium]
MRRHFDRRRLLLFLLAPWAVVAACGAPATAREPDSGEDTSTDDTDDTGADTASGPGTLATGVRIDRIQLCQTVCTDLMADLGEVEPAIPIVPGKPALIRIYHHLLVGWDYRSTWAQFEYDAPGVGWDAVSYQLVIEDNPSEQELDSTINFVVPGEHVAEGPECAFRLRENGGYADPNGGEPQAVWPAEGSAEIPIVAPEAPVEVVVVPIRYNADGSGRTPDTSPGALAAFAARFESMYPTGAVSVTAREPFDWDGAVLPGGDGWGELLVAITELRDSDSAAFEEYYYGLFEPADAFGSYCSGGCVLGLSYLAPDAGSAWLRSSIGIGFGGDVAADTMVHEVGHAHGLGHAPCGTSDADPAFPHADGTTGVFGYDDESGQLMSSAAYDFMSYCDPDWVSDFHYLALYDRIVDVNEAAKGAEPGDEPWRIVLDRGDGTVALGPAILLPAAPSGPARRIVLRDASRAELRSVEGRFQPFAGAAGGIVLFPAPPPGAAFVELEGYAPLRL